MAGFSARRILVTGMSGAGKSTALGELARLGFDVVETDVPPWSRWSQSAGGYVWEDARVAELLEAERELTLYVSGTVSNQGRFYPRFDAVVLLSAPADVLLSRIAARTDNPFGKSEVERERIERDLAEVEPLLRATCTHELDTNRPVADVVTDLVAIGAGAGMVAVRWCAEVGDHWIAPLHVHHEDDEAWYVISGALGFRLGDEEVVAGPGTRVVAPRGTPHTYWNASPSESEYLLVMPPRIASLVEAVHEPEADMPAVFRAHASELLPADRPQRATG